MVRVSTLRGFSGFSDIIEKNDYKIVRPLITVTKGELENFDRENNIPYRVDKSNFKDKYTRNRYRKYVLPFLKSEDPLVHEKFYNFSKQIIETDEYITNIASSSINEVYHDKTIDIDKFKKLDIVIGKRIIDLIFSELYLDDIIEIDRRHVDLVMNAINSNKTSLKFNLPNDYVLIKEYNKIIFKKDINAILPYDIELSNEVYLPNGLIIKKVDKCDTNGNDVLRLRSSDVKLPLRVRTRHNGDRINVMNMDGTKKVSEVLINAKLPLNKRDLWPIVVDSTDKVIWIPKIKKSKYNRLKNEECDIIFECFYKGERNYE